MKFLMSLLFLLLLSSCSTQYSGSHKDISMFNKDVDYCLRKSCIKSSFSLMIISSLHAYGGGGGGGASSIDSNNRFSLKTFNLCLKEKGYIKDNNGIFKLNNLTCK